MQRNPSIWVCFLTKGVLCNGYAFRLPTNTSWHFILESPPTTPGPIPATQAVSQLKSLPLVFRNSPWCNKTVFCTMMYLQVKSRCILGKILANPSVIDSSFHQFKCILLYAMENQHKAFLLFLYLSNNLYVGFYIFALHFAILEIFSDFYSMFLPTK